MTGAPAAGGIVAGEHRAVDAPAAADGADAARRRTPERPRAQGGRAARVTALARPLLPVMVGLVAFGLARRALLPGQGLWDTGEFQFVGPVLGTAHPTGFPAYVLLGWVTSIVLAPLGEPAFRMNLLSAILLGVAVAGAAWLAARLAGGRALVGAACGLALGVTPLAWRVATAADPHMLHLVLVLPLLALLLGWERRVSVGSAGADRWLVAAAAAFGLSLANHSLTLLLAPGIALYVLAVDRTAFRRRRLVVASAIALVGTAAAFYLELPIRAAMGAPFVYGHPDTFGGFWYVALGVQFGGALNSPFGDIAGKLGAVADMAWRDLGMLAPFVPAAFIVTAVRRPRYALLTGTWLLVTCWFAASYVNADIERYYLGPLLVAVTWLAIFAGVIADTAEAWLGLRGDEAEPVETDHLVSMGPDDGASAGVSPAGAPGWLPRAAIAAALSAAIALPGLAAAPATLAALDRSGDTIASRWTTWALATLPANAVVISWWDFSTPLWYRTLIFGERPDVTIIDDRTLLDRNLGTVDDVIRAELGRRPVFLVRMAGDLFALEARWRTLLVPDPNGIQSLVEVVGPFAGTGG